LGRGLLKGGAKLLATFAGFDLQGGFGTECGRASGPSDEAISLGVRVARGREPCEFALFSFRPKPTRQNRLPGVRESEQVG
jgi:hypothetical protein